MATSDGRRRSWWGWGLGDRQLDDDGVRGLGGVLAGHFGIDVPAPAVPVDPRSVALAAPRVALPAALADLASVAVEDRLRHGHGNAYRDVVRALHGDVPRVPDLVVRPRDADDVEPPWARRGTRSTSRPARSRAVVTA